VSIASDSVASVSDASPNHLLVPAPYGRGPAAEQLRRNTYGRVIGIIGGSLGAIGALLSIGGAYPWWSLAIFALCVYVVHGIIVYGEEERAPTT
jgi:hypothetical protein